MRALYPFLPTNLHQNLWKQMGMTDEMERESAPSSEVVEAEDHFLLNVDLPGVKKDEIKIEVLDKTLTISGERKRFDKSVGTLKASFILPNSVSCEKIEARHEDGVLQLYIPKTPAAQVRRIEIQPTPVTQIN